MGIYKHIQRVNDDSRRYESIRSTYDELVDYIYNNTHDLSKEDIQEKLNNLIENCYVIPYTKTVYHMQKENILMCLSKTEPSDSFDNKKPSFNCILVYDKFCFLMQRYYQNNLVKALINRYNHVYNSNHLAYMPLFLKYDHSLILNTDLINTNGYSPALTPKTLGFLLQNVLRLGTKDLPAAKLLEELWAYSNHYTYPLDSYKNFILTPDNYSSRVDFSKGFVQRHPNAVPKLPLSGYLKNYPVPFIEGRYSFSDDEKSILSFLIGTKTDNLNNLASLILAAYTNGRTLSVPTVIYAPTIEELERYKRALLWLFNIPNFIVLSEDEYQNPTNHIDTLSSKFFSGYPVLAIDSPSGSVAPEKIAVFSKCKLIKKGSMVIKNRVPLIIFTTNNSLCTMLNVNLKANIISTQNTYLPFNPDIFDEQIFLAFNRIRQSLLAYGIQKAKPKEKHKTSSQISYKQTLIESFAEEFVKHSEVCNTACSDIEEGFNTYMEFFTKNVKPKIVYRKIDISKYLELIGYTKKKKRIRGKENPVQVFVSTYFDKRSVDVFIHSGRMVPLTPAEVEKPYSSTTLKMINDLELCELKFDVNPVHIHTASAPDFKATMQPPSTYAETPTKSSTERKNLSFTFPSSDSTTFNVTYTTSPKTTDSQTDSTDDK